MNIENEKQMDKEEAFKELLKKINYPSVEKIEARMHFESGHVRAEVKDAFKFGWHGAVQFIEDYLRGYYNCPSKKK